MGPPPKMFTQPGDADYDGYVNVPDVIYLINYMTLSGPEPPNMKSADVDSSCVVDLVDIVYLVSFLFRGGPKPMCGCVEEEPLMFARAMSLRETADAELRNPVYASKEGILERRGSRTNLQYRLRPNQLEKIPEIPIATIDTTTTTTNE